MKNNLYVQPSLLFLVGRLFLASMFVESIVAHVINYEIVLQELINKELFLAQILFPISILVEIAGTIALVTTRWIRPAVVVLICFVLSSTFIFFPFWNLEGIERTVAQQNAVKNLAIIGFLIVIYGIYQPSVKIETSANAS